jgi:hypothetical protein
MKRIAKDVADKMVEDILIGISKMEDMPNGFAEESINIMNDPIDNSVITGILLSKARPSILDNNQLDMKATILASLQSVVSFGNREGTFEFNQDLEKEFSVEDMDKCSESTKLDFALNQFVNAFYEYERLEKKYPELMKIM